MVEIMTNKEPKPVLEIQFGTVKGPNLNEIDLKAIAIYYSNGAEKTARAVSRFEFSSDVDVIREVYEQSKKLSPEITRSPSVHFKEVISYELSFKFSDSRRIALTIEERNEISNSKTVSKLQIGQDIFSYPTRDKVIDVLEEFLSLPPKTQQASAQIPPATPAKPENASPDNEDVCESQSLDAPKKYGGKYFGDPKYLVIDGKVQEIDKCSSLYPTLVKIIDKTEKALNPQPKTARRDRMSVKKALSVPTEHEVRVKMGILMRQLSDIAKRRQMAETASSDGRGHPTLNIPHKYVDTKHQPRNMEIRYFVLDKKAAKML